MDHLFSNFKNNFSKGGVLTRLLYINIGVFVVTRLLLVVLALFNLNGNLILDWFYLPSNLLELAHQPWSVLTYMFFHKDFLHILFNMLWLYWFGAIFVSGYNQRTLGALYFLGGIFGALVFLLAYNLFPIFSPISANSQLLGASASVLAIVVATAMRAPNMSLNFFLIGSIRLKYIAAAIIAIDLFSITSSNAGGHWAHLGGALAGYLCSLNWERGRDWATRLANLWGSVETRLANRNKPKMKVKYNQARRAESDKEYNDRKNRENAELDRILDKIKQSGYTSLTEEEKKKLFNASK